LPEGGKKGFAAIPSNSYSDCWGIDLAAGLLMVDVKNQGGTRKKKHLVRSRRLGRKTGGLNRVKYAKKGEAIVKKRGESIGLDEGKCPQGGSLPAKGITERNRSPLPEAK